MIKWNKIDPVTVDNKPGIGERVAVFPIDGEVDFAEYLGENEYELDGGATVKSEDIDYWAYIPEPAECIPLTPVTNNGCRFPHCPKCNEELDIFLAGDDTADGNYIQANYCYYCGQPIDWTDFDDMKGE
jgi:hypothetical protein